MATNYKVLGQLSLTAGTRTLLYKVPSNAQAVVSSIIVTNVGSDDVSFDVFVAINGEEYGPKQYIYCALPLEGQETFVATIGLTLAANDEIRVAAVVSSGSVAFNLFGSERTT